MERFSVVAPAGHFSHFSLSAEDSLRLARTSTRLQNLEFDKFGNAASIHRISDGTLSEDKQREPVVFRPGARFYCAFSALAALALVIALDGTSISVALPVIANALHGTATDAFWSGTSFLLCSTVFQPIWAAFSHIFGRKEMALIAITLFLTGTLIAATSVNMIMMLIGRSVQGIGGGGITAMTNILITDLVPLRYRGNWIGILGAMWAIGSVTGPVVGGSLAHPKAWTWIFYLNVPFIVTSFVLVVMFIRLKSIPSTFVSKLQRADWVGSVVFIASITSILIPLTWGGVMYDWGSWQVIVPFGFGLTGFIILAYHERFVAIEPIIRTVVFANRTTNLAYLTTALHGMILWCLLYYQPLYFEGVRGYKPVMAGVALFPATFTVAPMAIATGIIISKTGRYRWAIWCGWAATTLGMGFLCAVDTDAQMVQVALTDLITGVGLGSLFPALQFQLQSSTNPRHLANAVAMFCFSRGLGQTLGIALGGMIFQNTLAAELSRQPIFAGQAQTLAKDATALVEYMNHAPTPEAAMVMRTAYTQSMRMVYVVMAAFALLATLMSFFVQHYDLDQALESEQQLDEDEKR